MKYPRQLPSDVATVLRVWALPLILAAAVIAQGPADFDLGQSPLPEPTSPVMDYAGVIDADVKAQIEEKILQFAENSSPKVEIGVAVVRTTGNIPIFDYSLAVARGWGIGSRQDDNPGLLLLVAIDDRKYFTQVSLDLEDELPDGVVGSLQRQFLVPQFKRGEYGLGILYTIDAYIKTIEAKQAGEPNPFAEDEAPEALSSRESGPDAEDIICCIAGMLGFGLFIWWSVRSAGRKGGGKGGGGGWGDSAGDVAIDIASGLIIGALSGGGSDSSGSWGGSSGGGWGGFSGGGSFGGGGAGGSW